MKAAAVPHSFEGGSPVSLYWLRQCEGFNVRSGRRRGRVEDVVLDADHVHATSVVVHYGALRKKVVPVEAVETVAVAQRFGRAEVDAGVGHGQTSRSGVDPHPAPPRDPLPGALHVVDA